MFRVILKQNLPSSEKIVFTCRHGGHISVQINGLVNYGLRQHGLIKHGLHDLPFRGAPTEFSENGIIFFKHIQAL